MSRSLAGTGLMPHTCLCRRERSNRTPAHLLICFVGKIRQGYAERPVRRFETAAVQPERFLCLRKGGKRDRSDECFLQIFDRLLAKQIFSAPRTRNRSKPIIGVVTRIRSGVEGRTPFNQSPNGRLTISAGRLRNAFLPNPFISATIGGTVIIRHRAVSKKTIS